MAGNSRSKYIVLTDEARVLKRLRLGNGLSLHAVAKKVGKSYSTIAHIENGRMGVLLSANQFWAKWKGRRQTKTGQVRRIIYRKR